MKTFAFFNNPKDMNDIWWDSIAFLYQIYKILHRLHTEKTQSSLVFFGSQRNFKILHFMKDPAISANETKPYPAYTEGVKKDVWIKNDQGEILFGKVLNAKSQIKLEPV